MSSIDEQTGSWMTFRQTGGKQRAARVTLCYRSPWLLIKKAKNIEEWMDIQHLIFTNQGKKYHSEM